MNFHPTLREKLRIVLNTYRMMGLLETVRSGLVHVLFDPFTDRFDEKYGVSTSGYVEPHEANIADEEASFYATRYVASDERMMSHLLETSLRGLSVRDFTFIDLGCGKGRSLLMAAQYPFREVVGVELSPSHAEIATQNIERYLANERLRPACRNVRAVCENALTFAFPEGDLFIYMYNPFGGTILRGVIDKIASLHAAGGRKIFVAYSCPAGVSLFEKHPSFIRHTVYQVISFDLSWTLWECRSVGSA